ncbi:MAG: hypothetical protein FH762_06260 [Firmicutes bacterium]|nr:hypothetical protein [Bacillota bacterium]
MTIFFYPQNTLLRTSFGGKTQKYVKLIPGAMWNSMYMNMLTGKNESNFAKDTVCRFLNSVHIN